MKNYTDVLKAVRLFKGIEEADLQPLLSCLAAKSVRFEKGQTVFSSGESIEKFGIVLSGQVQVVQDDYYGNRSILGKIDIGNLFGESFACAEIKVLPVSVITTTESELLFIDCHRLAVPCAKACGFHSKLIQNMLNIVSMGRRQRRGRQGCAADLPADYQALTAHFLPQRFFQVLQRF